MNGRVWAEAVALPYRQNGPNCGHPAPSSPFPETDACSSRQVGPGCAWWVCTERLVLQDSDELTRTSNTAYPAENVRLRLVSQPDACDTGLTMLHRSDI